jgi:hypothetical protein
MFCINYIPIHNLQFNDLRSNGSSASEIEYLVLNVEVNNEILPNILTGCERKLICPIIV